MPNIFEPNIRNFFYVLWLEMKRKIFGISHSADFDVTNNCQLNCKHCYIHYYTPEERFKEEPIEIWEKRLNTLYKKGVRQVSLLGGEPALRMDIVRLTVKTFPFVNVFTNGIIPIPRDIDIQVRLSVDGDQQTNDRIRGKGTYRKALDNYRGDPRVSVIMTLNMDNYLKLEDVVRMVIDEDFKYVFYNLVTNVGNSDNQSMVVGPEEWGQVVNEMERVKKKYPDKVFFYPYMFRWLRRSTPSEKCYWWKQVGHYDAEWNTRRCFPEGEEVCKVCGCFGGALQSPSKLIFYRSLEKLKRFLGLGA